MNNSLSRIMNDDNAKKLRPAPSMGMPSAQMISLPEMASHEPGNSNSSDSDTQPANIIGHSVGISEMHPLYQVKATLQVCVGEATVTVGELMSAKQHQVLKLDRTLENPVDLFLNGQVVARGQLVAVDGHFAVRITELPMPLHLGSAV